jgi:hypothetical protein
MKNELPSLLTPDTHAGMALADQLAGNLLTKIEQAGERVERPGGMNITCPRPYRRKSSPASSFYAIAAANGGWPGKADSQPGAEK